MASDRHRPVDRHRAGRRTHPLPATSSPGRARPGPRPGLRRTRLQCARAPLRHRPHHRVPQHPRQRLARARHHLGRQSRTPVHPMPPTEDRRRLHPATDGPRRVRVAHPRRTDLPRHPRQPRANREARQAPPRHPRQPTLLTSRDARSAGRGGRTARRAASSRAPHVPAAPRAAPRRATSTARDARGRGPTAGPARGTSRRGVGVQQGKRPGPPLARRRPAVRRPPRPSSAGRGASAPGRRPAGPRRAPWRPRR